MTTYEFYDNGNTIQMIKNVDGKITTTNFNKRNVSVTTGGNPELFEISDLRGSACPLYSQVTIPTSTSLDDLRSQINTWLDNINVEATIEVDSTGLATIVKQDEQIVILNSLDSKLNSLGQKPSSGSAPVVLSTEQEAILEAIKLAVQGIDLDTNGLAKDLTLQQTNSLLTTIDAVLDNIKTDTGSLVTDIASIESLLITIDIVLDAIKVDTGAIATDVAAIEVLITSTNSLLTSIDSQLDVPLSTLAKESTLLGISAKLNTLGQKLSSGSVPVVLSTEQEAILEAIKVAVQGIDLDTNGLAKDATLLQTNNLLTAIDLVLDGIDLKLDVDLSTRASEATLELVRLLLVSIDGKVATENTLLAAKGVLDNLLISTQNIEGYTDGLEALITATNTKLDTIISNTTGLATETTLAGIKSQTDKLTFNASNELIVEATIDPTGLATEAKQDVQIANQGSAGTPAPFGTGILGWLRGIWDRLNQFQFTGGKLDVNASVTSGPLAFKRDGLDQEVTKDTTTPTNNRPLPVDETLGNNQTTSAIVSSATSVLLMQSRPTRKEVVVRNDANKRLFICLFSPATTSTPFYLDKGQEWVIDSYYGAIYGIWDGSPTGDAYVTDIYE